ncbi:MAG: hypothetical protein DYG94_02870 [Leptolyngbya sp. PLA3]|nr:MAG: hypothetical protein EDM82_11430 [Cyanobacteria bacterium CYA]MCE7967671.1 hypothetical protein [Leptolyngbya sp. PL-A3]
MHPRATVGIAVYVLGGLAGSCGAQTYFDLWFEAPETVQAGATFTATVWGGAAGDWVDGELSSNFFACQMSVQILGDLAAFDSVSQASILTNFASDHGTPHDNWLEDVVAMNLWDLSGYIRNNPLPIFSFQVTTSPSGRGLLSLSALPSSEGPDLLWWYVEPAGSGSFFLGSADDNSVLTANPFTVRVIPAPTGVTLLALAPLTARRRRSSPQWSFRA